LNS
jgi:WD40 repeat protein